MANAALEEPLVLEWTAADQLLFFKIVVREKGKI